MKHIHKYERVDIGVRKSHIVWRCILKDCTHYLRAPMLIGKSCICWGCGQPMIIKGPVSKLQVRPVCCRKKSKDWKQTIESAGIFFKELIDGE